MIPLRRDWNVLATPRDGRFEQAKLHLCYLGITVEAPFDDLLLLEVPDIDELLEYLTDDQQCDSAMFEHFESIRPVRSEFAFETRGDFFERASELIGELAPKLGGERFSIRVHSRGGPLPEDDGAIENRLYNDLLGRLRELNEEATIGRTDCDFLIDVETVARTAGISMWDRADLRQYPFLGFRRWQGPLLSSDARSRSSGRLRT